MTTRIEFVNVSKFYGEKDATVKAVNDVSFSIEPGQLTVILGPSGAGKSTILNLLGGMDQVSQGSILVNGVDIAKLNEKQLATYHAQQIGFVFQFYNLIPTLTAYENVALIKELCKDSRDPSLVLEEVGLKQHTNQFPSQLSGGEQQRVSIARAIAKNPAILLCDEPTGALDSETGCTVLSLLASMVMNQQRSVVIVTHNAAIAQMAHRVIYMKNGSIERIEEHAKPSLVNEVNW